MWWQMIFLLAAWVLQEWATTTVRGFSEFQQSKGVVKKGKIDLASMIAAPWDNKMVVLVKFFGIIMMVVFKKGTFVPFYQLLFEFALNVFIHLLRFMIDLNLFLLSQ